MYQYGDQQAQLTMNRAAYGDVAAGMMMGAGNLVGGAGMGARNLMSDIGQYVMPATYSPSARVYPGFYGQYQEQTGFFRGAFGMTGFTASPRGTTQLEHQILHAGDFGERVSGGMAAGATTLAGSIGFGMATAPIFGAAGRLAGSALGSAVGLGGGISMGSLGTLSMGSIGGFLGGTIAAPLAGLALGNQVMDAYNQRREIQGFLESASFRFVGPGSSMADPRGMFGMNTQARQATADMIRKMDFSDPTLNTQDLTQILQGSASLGLFAGTGGDLENFKKRFKEITESVKSVTQTLHQTLEQGLQTIKDLKAIGLDTSSIKQVVGNADALGRIAGRTGTEMIQLGLQGAEVFKGTGINMGIGFQSTMMNQAAIRAARDAGFLSQEAIKQAGGEEAMAVQSAVQGLAFSQSAFGRGYGAAFFNPGMGPAGFNQASFMSAMTGGGGDFVSMAQRAAGNLGSPAALRTFQANQEKFMSEAGKNFGGRGLEIMQMNAAASLGTFLSAQTGASREVEYINAMKEMGVSMPQIEKTLAEMRGRNQKLATDVASVGQTYNKSVAEEAAQSFILYRAGAKVVDAFNSGMDTLGRPLGRMADSVKEGFQTLQEETMFGMTRVNTSGVRVMSASDAARLGVKTDDRALKVDINRTGGLADTAGEKLLDAVSSSALRGYGITGDSLTAADGTGIAIGGGKQISRNLLERAAKKQAELNITDEEAKKLANKDDVKRFEQKILELSATGQLAGKDFTDIASLATGRKGADVYGKMTVQEKAALTVAADSMGYRDIRREQSKKENSVFSAKEYTDIETQRGIMERYDQHRKTIQNAAGMDLASGVPELLAQASLEESSVNGSKEKANELRIQARKMQVAFSGKDGNEVASALQRAEVEASRSAREFSGLTRRIGNTQRAQGEERLFSALRNEIYGSSLSEEKRKAALNLVSTLPSIESIDMLSSSDRALLQSTSVGKLAMNLSGDVKNIRSGKGDVGERIKRAFLNQGASEELATEKVSTFRQTGDVDAAIMDLKNMLPEKFADKNRASGAGGALAGDGSQANAQQVAASQIASLTAIHVALDAVARRLKL